MKLPHSLDDFLLELLRVHGTLFRGLDEQGRRRLPAANSDALENEFTTGNADIVLGQPEVINDEHL